MIDGNDLAQQMVKYIGIDYETLDCQGVIKKACRDMGLSVSWRGSNDMWRNKVHGNISVADVTPRPGMLLFTIKHDGKEDKSKYKDGVNASHVGVYVGEYGKSPVIHSTVGGVQYGVYPDKRWTHAAYLNCIDYNSITGGSVTERIDEIISALEVLKKCY